MNVIDYMNKLNSCKNYLPDQGDYDDLFLAVIEYHFRAAKNCIVLDDKHLNGVAGLELRIKDKLCTDMFIIFVYLSYKALNPTYILSVLKDLMIRAYCRENDCGSNLPIGRGYVMYLLLEFSLVGEAGILPKAKRIANLSVTMCSSETCDSCYKACEKIEALERRESNYAFKGFC